MSKKCKTRTQVKRKTMKLARKSAMKAQYESWAKSGVNTKSFRSKKRGMTNKFKPHDHIVFKCGNPGCAKCFPSFQRVKLEMGMSMKSQNI